MIAVRLLAKSGAKWRQRALAVGRKLLRRAKANELGDATSGVSAATEVFDGYIIKATRTGRRAHVTIMDPPSRLFVPNSLQLSYTNSLSVGLANCTGRDLYDARYSSLAEDNTPTSTAALGGLTYYLRPANLWPYTIVGSYPFHDNVTPNPPKERVGALTYVRIVSPLLAGPVTYPFGTPDDAPLGVTITTLRDVARPADVVVVSEQDIRARTAMGILPRYSLYPGTQMLPQLPWSHASWYGNELVVVMAVVDSAQPTDATAWRDDAGIAGVLVFALGFEDVNDQPATVWKWHRLIRFDTIDNPLLRAEPWQPMWEGAWEERDAEPPTSYPDYVSGHTQNAIRSLDVAFGPDALTVFFTALHGRQGSSADGPLLFQQHSLASWTLTGIGGGLPTAATPTVLAHDIAAITAYPELVSAFGSGDPDLFREWHVRGADYLAGKPRALVDTYVYARASSTPWLSPGNPQTATKRAAGAVNEQQVWSPTHKVAEQARDVAGLVRANQWDAGDTSSMVSWPLAVAKATTKVSDSHWMIGGWAYPYARVPPTYLLKVRNFGAVMEYDGTSDTFMPSRRIPESGAGEGFMALAGSYPQLTCYQRRVHNEQGEVVRDASVIATWHEPAEVGKNADRLIYYSLGEALGFRKLRGSGGGTHGTFYMGPALRTTTYGYIFQGE